MEYMYVPKIVYNSMDQSILDKNQHGLLKGLSSVIPLI